MEVPSKKRRLSHLLAWTNSKELWKITHLLQSGENKSKAQPSGAWKRQRAKILESDLSCFKELQISGKDEMPVRFWIADIGKLLNYINEQVDFYSQRLALVSSDVLHLVLVEDEATGGNVLATSSSKKVHLWYFCVATLGDSHRPDGWFPLAAFPTRDAAYLPEGAGEVAAAVFRDLSRQLRSPMRIGQRSFSLRVQAMVGDYEALRSVLNAKGASALKPCLACKNVISRQHGAEVLASSPYFLTVDSAEVDKFDKYSALELHDSYDKFLQDTDTMSVQDKKEFEICVGFHIHRRGVLASEEARSIVSVGNLLYDSMHCYFANGIISSEIIHITKAFEKATQISLTTIQSSVKEVNWICKNRAFSSPSARAWLFNQSYFQGDMYKGSGTQTWYVFPLLLYYLMLLATPDQLPALVCFQALYQDPCSWFSLFSYFAPHGLGTFCLFCRLERMMCLLLLLPGIGEVYLELKKWRRGFGDIQALKALQIKHQELFGRFYSGFERPKHHFRHHLPDMYSAHGYFDCWACEARHRAYKKELADTLSGTYAAGSGLLSRSILTQLLHKQVWSLQDNPWFNGLELQCHSVEDVEQATGLQGFRIAKGYRLGSLHLQTDDVIFDGCKAAWIHFFAQSETSTFCILEDLDETPSRVPFARVFELTGRKRAVEVQPCFTISQPAWHYVEGRTVLCLE